MRPRKVVGLFAGVASVVVVYLLSSISIPDSATFAFLSGMMLVPGVFAYEISEGCLRDRWRVGVGVLSGPMVWIVSGVMDAERVFLVQPESYVRADYFVVVESLMASLVLMGVPVAAYIIADVLIAERGDSS